jgi:hypothetical protein
MDLGEALFSLLQLTGINVFPGYFQEMNHTYKDGVKDHTVLARFLGKNTNTYHNSYLRHDGSSMSTSICCGICDMT